jgi:hypothetical protein
MNFSGLNSRGNLNAYGGRNKYSVGLGKIRNTIGSINRPYQYCSRTSSDPLYCLFRLSTYNPTYNPTYSFMWKNPFGNGLTGPEDQTKSVNVMAFDSSGNLFVGGSFDNANGVACNCLSVFNPKNNTWSNPFVNSSQVNLFQGPGPVKAIVPTTTPGKKVYIGGITNDGSTSINGDNGVVVWDPSYPTIFSTLLGGTSSTECYCIAVTSNYVAVGNSFGWVYNTVPPDDDDITLASGIAIWNLNTESWKTIEQGEQGLNGSGVNVFRQVQNGTFVGGRFDKLIPNQNTFNNIAFYDGIKLVPLGTGIFYDDNTENTVYTIDVSSSGVVYVGGIFLSTGNNDTLNNTFNNIGKYDGVTWSSLGTGLNGTVNCVKFAPNGDLYATGEFTATGDGLVQLNYIARWDGSSWFPVVGGLNAKGYSLCFDAQGSLYVGGEFTMAGNVNCNCIVKLEYVCTNCF